MAGYYQPYAISYQLSAISHQLSANLGHESLATTGIYTQLADEVTKEIALNTETALDRLEEGRLKEAVVRYEPDFEGWDAFASEVLEWL